MRFDAIIIGAGAAGLFCARQAGRRGRKVLILEHNAQAGRKILISGGGRCNFTNLQTAPENFVSKNPHFCKSALNRFTPADFIEFVRSHRIEFYEKKLGQLFCRESARPLVEMLLTECARARVELRLNCAVKRVRRDDGFEVETNQGVFFGDKLVIATGGLSFPKIGATDFGYRIARQFGLKIVEPRPSLVPLVFSGEDFGRLAGIAVEALVSAGRQSFRENILFTHRGLSGPAILQISNYWRKEDEVSVRLVPDLDLEALFAANRDSKRNLDNFLGRFLPQRLAETFTSKFLSNKPLNRMNGREIAEAVEKLRGWRIRFKETEGYHKAEVTLGGIDTDGLSSRTMESKKIPGLYFIGEVVDVTGWLGGYNFQWAWSSGFAAGESI